MDAEWLSGSTSAGPQREHHDIDKGLATLTTAARSRQQDPAAVTRAIHALRRHIYLEEEFPFPPLAEAGLVAPVLVMLREHTQIWATLDPLQRELDNKAGAGPVARALAHQLAIQLLHHNLKEERILYPQADRVLTAAATQHLQAFLQTGQLPQGWVPTKARFDQPAVQFWTWRSVGERAGPRHGVLKAKSLPVVQDEWTKDGPKRRGVPRSGVRTRWTSGSPNGPGRGASAA